MDQECNKHSKGEINSYGYGVSVIESTIKRLGVWLPLTLVGTSASGPRGRRSFRRACCVLCHHNCRTLRSFALRRSSHGCGASRAACACAFFCTPPSAFCAGPSSPAQRRRCPACANQCLQACRGTDETPSSPRDARVIASPRQCWRGAQQSAARRSRARTACPCCAFHSHTCTAASQVCAQRRTAHCGSFEAHGAAAHTNPSTREKLSCVTAQCTIVKLL